MKFKYFTNFVQLFHNFIGPRECEICHKLVDEKNSRLTYICNSCYDNLPIAPPSSEIEARLEQTFRNNDLAINKVFSLFSLKEDSKFIQPIYSLKYFGLANIGLELGIELGKLIELEKDTDYDYIVPVPIHRARKRERGFNQSFYISLGIQKIINSDINEKLIKRNKYTQTQTQLNANERQQNMMNKIKPYKNGIQLNMSKILLVDDVLTTGSTMNVCADSLLDIGAQRVDAASIVLA